MRADLYVSGVFICFLLLLPVCVQANDSFAEGKRLFETGKYQQSYEVLNQAYREKPANLDISFYLGRAAFELGDFEMAAMVFERILIVKPDAPRVKLALAKTYLKLGSREIARQYFREVQASNPPEAVWQHIQSFLADIDKSERHHFISGIVTLGIFYDDNVGVFPNDSTVSINGWFGGPFRLTGKKEKDFGLQTTAILGHLYSIGQTPYSWKTNVSTFNNFYNEQHDQDLNYFGLTTGPAYRNNDTVWEVQALAGRVDIDDKLYFSQHGLNLYYARRLNRYLFINLGATLLDKDYEESSAMEAVTWNAMVNPVIEHGMNRLSLVLNMEVENADKDWYSYDRMAAILRYDRRLPHDMAIYGKARYQNTDFRDEMPLFIDKRNDKKTNIELGVSKTLWRSKDHRQVLAVNISHTYTHVESNIDLYEYDKHVTLTSLSFAF